MDRPKTRKQTIVDNAAPHTAAGEIGTILITAREASVLLWIAEHGYKCSRVTYVRMSTLQRLRNLGILKTRGKTNASQTYFDTKVVRDYRFGEDHRSKAKTHHPKIKWASGEPSDTLWHSDLEALAAKDPGAALDKALGLLETPKEEPKDTTPMLPPWDETVKRKITTIHVKPEWARLIIEFVEGTRTQGTSVIQWRTVKALKDCGFFFVTSTTSQARTYVDQRAAAYVRFALLEKMRGVDRVTTQDGSPDANAYLINLQTIAGLEREIRPAASLGVAQSIPPKPVEKEDGQEQRVESLPPDADLWQATDHMLENIETSAQAQILQCQRTIAAVADERRRRELIGLAESKLALMRMQANPDGKQLATCEQGLRKLRRE